MAITRTQMVYDLSQLAEQIKPEVERVLADHARRVLDGVRQGWPVETGESAGGWYADGAAIDNSVDYTPFVRGGLASRLVPEVSEQQDIETLPRLQQLVTDRLEV